MELLHLHQNLLNFRKKVYVKTRVEGEDKRLAMLLDMANLAVELKATLTLIWGGWVRDFTPPLPRWFSCNITETVKAVTLAFYRIQ